STGSAPRALAFHGPLRPPPPRLARVKRFRLPRPAGRSRRGPDSRLRRPPRLGRRQAQQSAQSVRALVDPAGRSVARRAAGPAARSAVVRGALLLLSVARQAR